jgi:hypothetical protein
MSKRGDIKYLEARIEALEEVIDFLAQDAEEDQPDEFISESDLVHEAYASHAAHPYVDTQAFVTGYIARAKEEDGIYAP